ncbi:Ro-like RNA binding protein [Microbacterium phage PauloDiaboli]|nr:Ro-like RNA binding protein [Microbacterium phage PauloDiaboli]QWY84002.1 Ro-like RNA binding protein [Microbacterium phage A3Wally]
MASSLKTVKTRKGMTATPQNKKARPEQVKNAAGGYTFALADMERVKRFLILGAETNFYTPGAKLASENAETIIRVASTDEGSRQLVDLIVEYSTQGRAPKQDAGLFALAIAASHGSVESKQYALSKLNAVARTGTTLIQFVSFALQFRGWGRSLKTAVGNWYVGKDADKAAYQIVKYRQREGWTHRDLFRTAHPKTQDPAWQGLGEWFLHDNAAEAPQLVKGFLLAQAPDANVPALVREFGLTWEMVPTQALNDREVWDALLDGNVPLGALLRQLPRLTNLGFFEKLKAGSRLGEVVKRLTDKEEIERARIHPIAVLTALKTYASGKSQKGSTTWKPSREILDALDKAFYLAFKNVVPAGKKFLIGLDVSGSMDGFYGYNQERPVLTPREATAAIALVTAATEPETHVVGFTSYAGGRGSYRYSGYGRRNQAPEPQAKDHYSQAVTDLDTIVSPNRRLDDVIRDVQRLPMGGTDIAVPIMYALEKGLRPEVFLILTDNETWAGDIQPFEALEKYRRETGIDAKVIFLSTEATKNTLIDPNDKNSLDIAGFDSAAPQIVSSFARGDF